MAGRSNRVDKIDSMEESNEKYFEYYKRIVHLKQMSSKFPHKEPKYKKEIDTIIDILRERFPRMYAIGVNMALNATSVKQLK